MIVKASQQWFKIDGKNAFGCPLRLELYLKVKCMNLSETNFRRTQSPSGYGNVSLAMSWTSNSTNTGDIHKNNCRNIILDISLINRHIKQARLKDTLHLAPLFSKHHTKMALVAYLWIEKVGHCQEQPVSTFWLVPSSLSQEPKRRGKGKKLGLKNIVCHKRWHNSVEFHGLAMQSKVLSGFKKIKMNQWSNNTPEWV